MDSQAVLAAVAVSTPAWLLAVLAWRAAERAVRMQWRASGERQLIDLITALHALRPPAQKHIEALADLRRLAAAYKVEGDLSEMSARNITQATRDEAVVAAQRALAWMTIALDLSPRVRSELDTCLTSILIEDPRPTEATIDTLDVLTEQCTRELEGHRAGTELLLHPMRSRDWTLRMPLLIWIRDRVRRRAR